MDDVTDAEHVREAEKRFLEGCRSEKTFAAEQEATLPLMRRLVRMQSYAVILHVLSEDVPDQPDRMTEITEKLTGVLRNAENAIPRGE